MHTHSNFDRAVTLTRAVDAALTVDETSDQKGVFDAIYDTLEAMELHEAAESEQLDEEEVYELTPAGENYVAHPSYPDLTEEFNPFSPSVGTFEGTSELIDLIGIKRAPVAERAYANVPTSVGGFDPSTYIVGAPSQFQKTIAEAFAPCGAD